MEQNQIEEQNETPVVPWSVTDTWVGVGLLVLLSLGMAVLLAFGVNRQYLENIGVLVLEMMYLLPVVLIFAWRRVHWRTLGFGRFNLETLALGFGLLLGGYVIIIAHNMLLYWLGVDTQGDQVFEIFNQLESPVWFFFVGSLVAPFVEEIFFRGFLFQGFRQKYGWLPALLLSSAIFSLAHLDPVSLVPTFVLGCVLAFVYHRSNSLWPGILFHAAINSFSLCAVYFISQNPGLIPA